MQYFVHDRVNQVVNFFLIILIQIPHPTGGLIYLIFHNFSGLVAQGDYRWHGFELLLPVHVSGYFFINYRFGFNRFLFADIHIFTNNILKVVDIIKINILQRTCCRFDVAGYGYINQKQ